MSVGTTLLELQETDLALARDRATLKDMPELVELAKKRRAYQKLKADAVKLAALAKDQQTYLTELDEDQKATEEDIERAQASTDTSDYHEVQQLEIDLSTYAKRLDKIAFARKSHEAQLAELTEKQRYLSEYTAKFEASVVAETRAARERAAGLQEAIAHGESTRERLSSALPPEVLAAYEKASARFSGLAVERLQGNVPSICRTALQASSMSDLNHAADIATCPYCHRMLVMDAGE